MNYPEFFDTVETIKLKDQLSQTLGAFSDGVIEFSYKDVVKVQGIHVLQLQVHIYL